MRAHIYETPQALGQHLAARITAGICAANSAGRDYVLGCPGGRSPLPVYEALAQQLAVEALDCSRLIIAMMDEYLLADAAGNLSPPPVSAHFSCRGFGQREIVDRINCVLPEPYRIPRENFWMPDAAAPANYDKQLKAAGGIDLFLLASGAGDGHIAFNPPGSARESETRIVKLAEQTRRDNLATFPDFRSLDEVPTHGVTIGIGSIATLSAAAAMTIFGKGKRQAFNRLTSVEAYDPAWPATIVVECCSAEIHADRHAAGK